MVCGAAVLLAADSEARGQGGLKKPVDKLWHPQGGVPVAMGVAGSHDPGVDFIDRMGLVDWSEVATVESLRARAEVQLSRANKAVVDDLRAIEKVWGYENYMAGALVVSCLENRPTILQLAWNAPASLVRNGYAFIGVAAVPALMVLEALRQERGEHFQLDGALLAAIMDLAVKYVDGVGGPIRMMRVSAAGVEDVA